MATPYEEKNAAKNQKIRRRRKKKGKIPALREEKKGQKK